MQLVRRSTSSQVVQTTWVTKDVIQFILRPQIDCGGQQRGNFFVAAIGNHPSQCGAVVNVVVATVRGAQAVADQLPMFVKPSLGVSLRCPGGPSLRRKVANEQMRFRSDATTRIAKRVVTR